MTTCRLITQKPQKRYLIICGGHAGNEIVCAGISAVCEGIAVWAMNHVKNAKETVYVDISDGYFFVCFPMNSRTKTAFEIAAASLRQIEHMYSECITVTDIVSDDDNSRTRVDK